MATTSYRQAVLSVFLVVCCVVVVGNVVYHTVRRGRRKIVREEVIGGGWGSGAGNGSTPTAPSTGPSEGQEEDGDERKSEEEGKDGDQQDSNDGDGNVGHEEEKGGVRAATGVRTCSAAETRAYDSATRTHFNGIQLPDEWPPRGYSSEKDLQSASRVHPEPPYLSSLPAVIGITVGRQLFVDGFLVAGATGVTHSYHAAEYVSQDGSVVHADKAWERGELMGQKFFFAEPAWDNVVWMPEEKRYRAYYKCGVEPARTCLAYTEDITKAWVKAELPDDTHGSSNIVRVPYGNQRASSLIRFHDAPSEDMTWMLFEWREGNMQQGDEMLTVWKSKTGVRDWVKIADKGQIAGDGNVVFYNPWRKTWTYSLRENMCNKLRIRRYFETESWDEAYARYFAAFNACNPWKEGQPVYWLGGDSKDPPNRTGDRPLAGVYYVFGVGYESILFMPLGIYTGHPPEWSHHDKGVHVSAGFSRDGFHIYRPDDRTPLVGDLPDFLYLLLHNSVMHIQDETLYFVVAGRHRSKPVNGVEEARSRVLVAKLRRDGFASWKNEGEGGGLVESRWVRFCGGYFFFNGRGFRDESEFRVDLIVRDDADLAKEHRVSSVTLKGQVDSTKHRLEWPDDAVGRTQLAAYAGEPVRFDFHLKHFELFSFWVSDDEGGRSYGWVAGGGPAYDGPRDV